MQTIKPSNTQLFAKRADKEKVTNSGFYVSEQAAERPQTAEVINVGDGVKQFASGDTIIYKSYSTTEIKLNGKEYLLVDESDVLGKVIEVEE